MFKLLHLLVLKRVFLFNHNAQNKKCKSDLSHISSFREHAGTLPVSTMGFSWTYVDIRCALMVKLITVKECVHLDNTIMIVLVRLFTAVSIIPVGSVSVNTIVSSTNWVVRETISKQIYTVRILLLTEI